MRRRANKPSRVVANVVITAIAHRFTATYKVVIINKRQLTCVEVFQQVQLCVDSRLKILVPVKLTKAALVLNITPIAARASWYRASSSEPRGSIDLVCHLASSYGPSVVVVRTTQAKGEHGS